MTQRKLDFASLLQGPGFLDNAPGACQDDLPTNIAAIGKFLRGARPRYSWPLRHRRAACNGGLYIEALQNRASVVV